MRWSFVQTRTVIAWQHKRFREHWTKLSKHGKPGRPAVSKEIRALIRKMSEDNVGWGSPRIVEELRKLGINVAKSTVEKYRVRSRKQPSPTWKAFLNNHVQEFSVHRFLRGAHREIQSAVRYGNPRPSSSQDCELQCYGAPHRTVDRSADHLSFSLGYRTEVFTARPQCYLWKPVSEARQKHGYRRGSHCAAETLAERFCGTDNWQHPTRFSESCHRVE